MKILAILLTAILLPILYWGFVVNVSHSPAVYPREDSYCAVSDPSC